MNRSKIQLYKYGSSLSSTLDEATSLIPDFFIYGTQVKSQADSADSQAAEEAKTVEIAALRVSILFVSLMVKLELGRTEVLLSECTSFGMLKKHVYLNKERPVIDLCKSCYCASFILSNALTRLSTKSLASLWLHFT